MSKFQEQFFAAFKMIFLKGEGLTTLYLHRKKAIALTGEA
jgi:hypothetical protein